MRRTNYRGRMGRSFRRFCAENHRLLIYLFFLTGGIAGGLALLPESAAADGALASLVTIEPVDGSFAHSVTQVFSSCFSVECLLAVLFICGLSACGIPVTILAPVFYGLGLGLTQAYWGAQGSSGILISALLVWPHSLVEMVALLMGCCESLRMSLLLASQLLPSGSIGGLWRDFKLYLIRFLLFIVIAFAAGVEDVLLRMFLLPLLQ